MHKSLYFLSLAVFALLMSCAAPKYTDDQTKDKVMTFHMHAQARAYGAALQMMTKEERKSVSTEQGEMREEYKAAIRRLQASTLLNESFSLDKYGNIVGMKSVLDRIRGVGVEDVMTGTGDLSEMGSEAPAPEAAPTTNP